MATGLGEAGAAVAITARREQWLTPAGRPSTAKGIDCLATTCDVTQPNQVDAAVAAVIERFGRLDILVNNAGISWGEPVETMPLEKWRGVVETNVTGCFLMAQDGRGGDDARRSRRRDRQHRVDRRAGRERRPMSSTRSATARARAPSSA